MNVGDWVVGADCGDDSVPGRVEWVGGENRERVVVNKLGDLRLHDAKDLRVVPSFQPGRSFVRLIGANAAENRRHGRVETGRVPDVHVTWPDGHSASYSRVLLIPDRPIPYDAEWRKVLKWMQPRMRVRRKDDGSIFWIRSIGVRQGIGGGQERFVRMMAGRGENEGPTWINPSIFEPAPDEAAPDPHAWIKDACRNRTSVYRKSDGAVGLITSYSCYPGRADAHEITVLLENGEWFETENPEDIAPVPPGRPEWLRIGRKAIVCGTGGSRNFVINAVRVLGDAWQAHGPIGGGRYAEDSLYEWHAPPDPRPSHVTFPCTLAEWNAADDDPNREYDRAKYGAAAELARAVKAWPPFNSAHEGLAVLQEEVKELADHVYMNQKKRDLAAMRKEALQVAAMALRFAAEVCDETRGRK